MESRQIRNKGELVLLAIFALFTATYLIKISALPIEGRILSYLLAPFIFGLLCFCFYRSFSPAQTEKELQKNETNFLSDRTEIKYPHKTNVKKEEKRLFRAMAMSCFLLLAIFLLGFYIGSGLMLLIWFLVFKKFNIKTIAIIVVSPLLLYVIFELIISFGLYEGFIFTYISR